MFDKNQLKVYFKYKDELDSFERFNSKMCREIFPKNELQIIDNIIHDLEIIKKSLCSKEFEEKTNEILEEKFDNDSIELIKKHLVIYEENKMLYSNNYKQ